MKLPSKFSVIIFLDKPENHVNREARIARNKKGSGYHISNLNMPYIGTLSYLISQDDLLDDLQSGLIQLK